MSDDIKMKQDLFELIHVMTALTSEHNLEKLLRMIVSSAMEITHSDAASLYLKHGDNLRFVITSNKTLEKRIGKAKFEASYKSFDVPISKESISGFVAFTGRPLNIPDVYDIHDRTYSFNKKPDKKNKYTTMSMLTVPLINREGSVIGVLQLINKLSKKGKKIVFNSYDEEITISLGAQAAIAIENARLTEQLKKAHYDSIMILSAANEFRDNETGFHVKRVSLFCELLAKTIGMDEHYVDNIKYASPLHDIGKIGIPDYILKKPGKLDNDEYEIMKTHTSIGPKILGEPHFEIMKMAAEIAISHHEKWDGTGYPIGLKGEDIPLSGRITAVADVFDALSNKRVYKPAFSIDKTFKIMEKDSGTHFDPRLVEAFIDVRDEILIIYDAHKEKD